RGILQRGGIDRQVRACPGGGRAIEELPRGVELRPRRRIRKDAVRLVDALDLLLGQLVVFRVAAVAIRVKGQRQEAIAAANLVVGSRRRNPKYLVVVDW